MKNMIEALLNGGIATGIIAGIVAAGVQFLIAGLEHNFITKTKKNEQIYEAIGCQRDKIEELIGEVSAIRVPSLTETDEDIIENAYHLIMADFERAKPLLYKKNDCITIKGYINALTTRYNQVRSIKLGYEKELKLEKAKEVLIGEMQVSKQKLLSE